MQNSKFTLIGVVIAIILSIITLWLVLGHREPKGTFGSSTVYAENYSPYIRQNAGFYTQYPMGTESTFAAGATTITGATSITGATTITGNATISGSSTMGFIYTSGNTFSSSSPAAMGSSVAGGFVIAAGQTTVGVSTTAVTANSNILIQYDPTITVAGLTCNTNVNASTTWGISSRVAGNGFVVKVASAPVTNPFCFTYLLTN